MPGTWPFSTSRCITDDNRSSPMAASPSSSGAATGSLCKRRCSFMIGPACLAGRVQPCLTPDHPAMPCSYAPVMRMPLAGVRLKSSECRGCEVIEQRQCYEKHDPDAEAPADELLLYRQQRLGLRAVQFFLNVRLGHMAVQSN